MSMHVTSTETPLFWETLREHRTYASLARLSMAWPGEIASPAHQPGCFDPYGAAAWCDCNNLTREDAYDGCQVCDGWCECDEPACGPGCLLCEPPF